MPLPEGRMSIIEAVEASKSFDSILDRVEAKKILITRDGKP
jgi:hypothetical protein